MGGRRGGKKGGRVKRGEWWGKGEKGGNEGEVGEGKGTLHDSVEAMLHTITNAPPPLML